MNLQNYFNYIDSVVKTFRDPNTGIYFICLNDLIKLSKHADRVDGIRRTLFMKYKSNYPIYYLKDIPLSDGSIESYAAIQLVYELAYDLQIDYNRLFILWLSTKESMQIGDKSFLEDIYEVEVLRLREILFKELNDIRNESLDVYNCYRDSNGIKLYNPNDYIMAFMNRVLSCSDMNISMDMVKRYYNINDTKDMIRILSRETMEELIWYIRMCKYWIRTNLFPLGPINILNLLRFRFNEPTFMKMDINKRLLLRNGSYMILDNRFQYENTDKELIFQKCEQFQDLEPLHVRVINGIVYFKAVDVYNIIDIKNYNNRNILRKQEQYENLLNSIESTKEPSIPRTKAGNPNRSIYPVEVIGKDRDFYNTKDEWINLAKVNNINRSMLLEIPRSKGVGSDLFISYALFPIIAKDYPDNRITLTDLEVWLHTTVLPIVRKSYFLTEMNKYLNSELQMEFVNPSLYKNCESIFNTLKVTTKYRSDLMSAARSLAHTIIDTNKSKNHRDLKQVYFDIMSFSLSSMIGFGIDIDSLISFLNYSKETTKNMKFW